MHVWLIEWLLNSRVRNPGNIPDSLKQRIRISLIARGVVASYLDIDGSRQPDIKDLADHIGRQERKRHTGKLFSQADTQVVYVLRRFVVVNRESYENIRVRGPYCSCVVVGRIDAAVGEP